MTVNGNTININNEIALSKFLEKSGYNLKRIAVEKNGIIIPKYKYQTEILSNNDKLEIVHFVGGG